MPMFQMDRVHFCRLCPCGNVFPCRASSIFITSDIFRFNFKVTLPGTDIPPKNGLFKMIFLFPRWDMLVPWRVFSILFVCCRYRKTRIHSLIFKKTPFQTKPWWKHRGTVGHRGGGSSRKFHRWFERGGRGLQPDGAPPPQQMLGWHRIRGQLRMRIKEH